MQYGALKSGALFDYGEDKTNMGDLGFVIMSRVNAVLCPPPLEMSDNSDKETIDNAPVRTHCGETDVLVLVGVPKGHQTVVERQSHEPLPSHEVSVVFNQAI